MPAVARAYLAQHAQYAGCSTGEVTAAQQQLLPLPLTLLRSAAPGRAYQALRRRWPSTELVLYGDRLHLWTERGEDDARAAVGLLEQNGCGPASFEAAAPTLEDAFVALVGAGERQEKPHESPA